MELKDVIILLLLASTITLAVLYVTKDLGVKKDLENLLNQPGGKPTKSEKCFIHKAAVSVNKEPVKLGALIGLTCAESVMNAITTKDFSKVSPICKKYFPEFSENYKKWATECSK